MGKNAKLNRELAKLGMALSREDLYYYICYKVEKYLTYKKTYRIANEIVLSNGFKCMELVRAGDGISVAEIGAEESSRRWSEILLPLVDRRAELLITAADGTRYAGFRSELEQRLLSAVGLMCGWYPVQPNPDGYPVNLYVSTYIDAAVYLSRRYAKKRATLMLRSKIF